ncbi:unnamed protein product [Victoria cruziana]
MPDKTSPHDGKVCDLPAIRNPPAESTVAIAIEERVLLFCKETVRLPLFLTANVQTSPATDVGPNDTRLLQQPVFRSADNRACSRKFDFSCETC